MSTAIRPSYVLFAAMLAFVALPPAQAQSHPLQQDKMTKRQPHVADPFSPFVYDVLGATPSLKLRKGEPAPAAVRQQQTPADEAVAAQQRQQGIETIAGRAKQGIDGVEARTRAHATQ